MNEKTSSEYIVKNCASCCFVVRRVNKLPCPESLWCGHPDAQSRLGLGNGVPHQFCPLRRRPTLVRLDGRIKR